MKTYILNENGSRRLGDKTEYFFDLQGKENGPREIINLIDKVLNKKGITAEQILDNPDVFYKLNNYEEIRKEAGLTASQKQDHVLSFIEKLLQKTFSHQTYKIEK